MTTVCPICGNTDFEGVAEGDTVRCPVPGCGAVFPRGRQLAWEPADPDEIMAVHPLGRDIRRDDTVLVGEGQTAALAHGGRTFWLNGPVRRAVGYEWRTEAEILRARRGGDPDDFPPLTDTSLTFFDLRVHPRVTAALKEIRPFRESTAIAPVFRMDLAVADPERLRKQAPDVTVTLRDAAGWAAQRLQRLLEAQLTERLRGCGEPAEAAAQLEQAVRDPNLAVEGGEHAAEDLGLALADVRVVSCAIHRNWCSVCGQAVAYPDAACPAGHPVRWCPLCRGVIHHATGECGGGHRYVWCPYCRMNVRERCAIHHGGTGPFRPDMKIKGE